MKIRVRYDNEYQLLEVDAEELWVSLSLEGGEDLTQEEKEILIQDAFDEQFNKPEYNNWHKFDRHRGNLKKQYRKDDEDADEGDGLDTVADNSQEEERNRQYEYEDCCQRICKEFKPKYAEVIIAICINGMTPEEYATQTGEKRDAIYKRLQRAKKILKEIWLNCPI